MSRGVAGRVIGQTTTGIRLSSRHVIADDETREPLTNLPRNPKEEKVKKQSENRQGKKRNSSGVVPPP